MTKVKVFVYGRRQRRQRQQRRGYDNSSPDFRHGELKNDDNRYSILSHSPRKDGETKIIVISRRRQKDEITICFVFSSVRNNNNLRLYLEITKTRRLSGFVISQWRNKVMKWLKCPCFSYCCVSRIWGGSRSKDDPNGRSPLPENL